MGFLKVLRTTKRKERELRILLLGLDNAGKTTALQKISGEDTDCVMPTVGFSIKTFEHHGYQLNMWDVGGQKTIRAFWRNYFEATEGVIWVVDAADINRLAECREELFTVIDEQRLAGCAILILANKLDLPSALPHTSIREILKLDAIVSHPWLLQPCSCKTGEGLEEGVEWLVNIIGSQIYF